MDLLKFMIQLDICYYLVMKNMMQFMMRLDILQLKKSGITYSISHNFARIKIDSYNSLPIEKTLIFYNVMILIKSVVNKSKNNYYYNILLEKSMTINPIHSF